MEERVGDAVCYLHNSDDECGWRWLNVISMVAETWNLTSVTLILPFIFFASPLLLSASSSSFGDGGGSSHHLPATGGRMIAGQSDLSKRVLLISDISTSYLVCVERCGSSADPHISFSSSETTDFPSLFIPVLQLLAYPESPRAESHVNQIRATP